MKPIINPDLYHGMKKDNKFFEGWYFKIVDKDNKYKFAFIPGIALDKKSKSSHCFIQIVDGYNLEYNYLSFNVSKFKFNNTNFNINITSNIFSLNHLELNLEYINKSNNTSRSIKGIFSLNHLELNLEYINKSNNTSRSIKGILRFTNTQKWPDNLINPGSMGFYNYISFMESKSS